MRKFICSFFFAWNGIRYCTRTGTNFKIQLGFGSSAVFLGFILKLSSFEWLILLFCIGLVLCLEMFNTSLEQVCNLVNKEKDPVIMIIKDVAAGAVLVASGIALICGTIIFFPKIVLFIHSISSS